MTFGQRYMLQGALHYHAAATDAKVKAVLEASIRLHMLALVKKNLAWYLINGCVSDLAAVRFDDEMDQAVKDYVPHTNTVLDSLGMPTHQEAFGPITRDYVAFTSQPDPEDLTKAGPLFDFRQTGAPRPRL